MKDSEKTFFYIISMFFGKKGLPILIICVLIYFFFFRVAASFFICTNNICRVENRTTWNIVLSSKNIDLSEIKKFSYYNDFDYLRYLNNIDISDTYYYNRNRYNSNRYYIFAETETNKYVLFDKSSKSNIKAKKVVNKLNALLSEDNVNTVVKYWILIVFQKIVVGWGFLPQQ